MLKMPGYHIGDSWYYVEGSCCHCFYLCCPDTQPRHTCWDIAHATSTDLRTWTLHGIVLHAQADNWGKRLSFHRLCAVLCRTILDGLYRQME